ncbi:aminoacyl-histidine dipeptidase [Weeksella virosa]|uniref:aminoacyl-histidine dipeptidase n=1 Tax=Weeksella virosa TaxID=1014 RepID=UPI000E008F8C|nr:aminoacyl-histidine dipeptidase [Weeksella virosa]MDK7374670.1 aminoacyl-histidine dipeptidase [Weeksella virosa]MDK7674818.1 aminoacyl-histidine dipeptidase [Weeksella virosa]SUP54540.1 Cytosol non-specific dipeptidase [Weeksella virosa]
MSEIFKLEPKPIWKNFHALNQIPRPSKKEEKVRQFIIDFGEKLGLDVSTDKVGNVLIKKSAYPGMEDRKKVVLQSHLDMVTQKNNDIDFDFDTQPIEMYVDDGFVKANGTTLGADNGIGVAAIMSILESKEIPHPAIEAFFTIDEETGMTGALGLQPNFLSGKILLNLDTEEDDELDIGCAGGVDITAKKTYSVEKIKNKTAFQLVVKGLQGGHSGMQIHEGLGNSNKILGRILYHTLAYEPQISTVNSGGLRNAIPREGIVEFALNADKENEFRQVFETVKEEVIEEFSTKEPKLSITLENVSVAEGMSVDESTTFIRVLNAAFSGVFRMSPDVEGLVETSNNLARVEVGEGNITFKNLTRSSVESGKEYLSEVIRSIFELGGFSVEFSGSYPGWKANPKSEILSIMKQLYTEKFGEEPRVVACHAGLECGIIGRNYPGLDMISFGPNIYGAHSPDERVEIKSVQKFWDYLLLVLKEIPVDGVVDYSCEVPKQYS